MCFDQSQPINFNQCIVGGSNCGPVVRRGLCVICYQRAWHKINSGVYSWEDLESMGMSLPKKKTHSKKRTRKVSSSIFETKLLLKATEIDCQDENDDLGEPTEELARNFRNQRRCYTVKTN